MSLFASAVQSVFTCGSDSTPAVCLCLQVLLSFLWSDYPALGNALNVSSPFNNEAPFFLSALQQ